MKKLFVFTILAFATLSPESNIYAAEQVETELLGDRWYYPFNMSPGTRRYGSMFCYLYDPDSVEFPQELPFNFMDGYVITKFGVSLPPAITGDYKITSASLVAWQTQGAQWNPHITSVTLFAAGFGPDYSESTWQETNNFVGGNLSGKFPRDPFPRDLTDDSHVEDNVTTATPWVIASHPDYLTTATGTLAPFKFTYQFDVNNPRIQQELKDDLASGYSSWILGSTMIMGDHSNPGFPEVYLDSNNPGVTLPGNAGYPTLAIEVESLSGIREWELY